MWVLQIEDDLGLRQIELHKNKVIVGRGDKCDVRLKSKNVSRRHATLVQSGGVWKIIDGVIGGDRSLNGLFHNDLRISAANLSSGDILKFGSTAKATFLKLTQGQAEPDERPTFIS